MLEEFTRFMVDVRWSIDGLFISTEPQRVDANTAYCTGYFNAFSHNHAPTITFEYVVHLIFLIILNSWQWVCTWLGGDGARDAKHSGESANTACQLLIAAHVGPSEICLPHVLGQERWQPAQFQYVNAHAAAYSSRTRQRVFERYCANGCPWNLQQVSHWSWDWSHRGSELKYSDFRLDAIKTTSYTHFSAKVHFKVSVWGNRLWISGHWIALSNARRRISRHKFVVEHLTGNLLTT